MGECPAEVMLCINFCIFSLSAMDITLSGKRIISRMMRRTSRRSLLDS